MTSTAEQAILARKYLTYLCVKKIAIEQALNSLSTVADRAMLLALQSVCTTSIDSICTLGSTRDSQHSPKTNFRDVANVAAGMIVLDFEYEILVEKAGGPARAWERVTENWIGRMIELLKGKVEICVGLRGVYGE